MLQRGQFFLFFWQRTFWIHEVCSNIQFAPELTEAPTDERLYLNAFSVKNTESISTDADRYIYYQIVIYYMEIHELDYLGVLPLDNESRIEFKNRAEEFLGAAYALQDEMKKNAYGILKENGILKLKLTQDRDVTGNPILVDGENSFFKKCYKTNPDWISVIEAKSINYAGLGTDVSFNEINIPVAIVDPSYGEVTAKHHESTHCIRREFFEKVCERPSEENLIMGLTNNDRDHTLSEECKHSAYARFALASIPWLYGVKALTSGIQPPTLADYGIFLFLAGTTLPSFIDGIKNYRAYKRTTPTKIAFEKILSSEENGSDNKFDVQYSLLRLTTPEIREIGTYMQKNNTTSGKTAIMDVLGKRDNLRSEIVLEKIS